MWLAAYSSALYFASGSWLVAKCRARASTNCSVSLKLSSCPVDLFSCPVDLSSCPVGKLVIDSVSLGNSHTFAPGLFFINSLSLSSLSSDSLDISPCLMGTICSAFMRL